MRFRLEIKESHSAFTKSVINLLFDLFRFIHRQHFKQEWNGKKQYKLLAITGIKSALIDDVFGQRSKIEFCWKIGKYYL